MPRSITGEVRTVEPDPAFGDEVLLVRADAGPAIGVGHVMRCIALAEAWIELGGRVVFASADLPVPIEARIAQLGCRVVAVAGSEETVALAGEVGARFAVIDGYEIGPHYQHDLHNAGVHVLVLDDRGESATDAADVILNQNAGARAELYAGKRGLLLLGREYTLIRREFRAVAHARSVPETARRILVSFGGADPANLAPVAIEALAPVSGLHVRVVVGAANAKQVEAPADAAAMIEVVPWLQDIAGQMRWAELAIVAAGGTCWELAACGVPMIAVPIADNQLAVSESLGDLGIGIPLARDAVSAESLRAIVTSVMYDQIWRGKMQRKGPDVIDGRGAFRVCAALRGIA
ncbi:MAG: UDP-2,4-diacetamido-2,4,6-trideoxy-beta-L-altropyranose hydrolase [Deltaproteobacteria bacterium]|nr:UDP-2,4-diacetamido-2,4,6-trideoxy-beta-L-altropyranose hydrolase [Deltaproteobacteria bacterium]